MPVTCQDIYSIERACTGSCLIDAVICQRHTIAVTGRTDVDSVVGKVQELIFSKGKSRILFSGSSEGIDQIVRHTCGVAPVADDILGERIIVVADKRRRGAEQDNPGCCSGTGSFDMAIPDGVGGGVVQEGEGRIGGIGVPEPQVTSRSSAPSVNGHPVCAIQPDHPVGNCPRNQAFGGAVGLDSKGEVGIQRFFIELVQRKGSRFCQVSGYTGSNIPCNRTGVDGFKQPTGPGKGRKDAGYCDVPCYRCTGNRILIPHCRRSVDVLNRRRPAGCRALYIGT